MGVSAKGGREGCEWGFEGRSELQLDRSSLSTRLSGGAAKQTFRKRGQSSAKCLEDVTWELKDTETFKAFRLTAPQEGRLVEKKLSPGHQGCSEGGKGEQRRPRGEAGVRGPGEQSIAGGGGAQCPSVKGQMEEEECGSGHVDGGD